MERLFVIFAAVVMALGVAAGAFGAHALRDRFRPRPELTAIYETAVRYQMIHGLGLLAVAWAATVWPGPFVNAAGALFVAGVVLFSGSLYLLTLTGVRWLGAITPIGGLAFIAGWITLLLAAWLG
jgi:uncharacterized membrane protein YgdD (TMEM256/DUF423 family)